MRAYGFAERLAWSEFNAPDDSGMFRILRSRIPACTHIERADESDDRQGTDYWAHRRHGLRPLSIDLKARSEDPIETRGCDDVALEIWSVHEQQIPGWTRDERKVTDYVLFFWEPTRRFLLVAFPALCNCFQRYWQQWASEYKTAVQRSDGWHSECVFVPRVLLIQKLSEWQEGRAA